MGRELSLSRRRQKGLAKSAEPRERERKKRDELVTYVALHLALSKQAYSVCTQALRDVSFKREGKKGERQDE